MIFSNLILLGVERNQWHQEQWFASNYGPGAKWTQGVIEKQTGPVSFLVMLADGRLYHCYHD